MKWKIVPVEATPEMLKQAAFEYDDALIYQEAIAAAPTYVVTDEDVEAIHMALRGTGAWTILRFEVRPVIEAFLKRLGGES